MIRYWFGPDDLGRVRFAIAPVFELAASIDVLREPGAHALHTPWVRWARERVDPGRIELLRAVLNPSGYRPDFVTPPPDTPRPTLAESLERVRATPPAQVRKELAWAYPSGRMPAAAAALVAEPARGLEQLVAEMAAYWELALAPWWDRTAAALEADVAQQARARAAGGPLAALPQLHPRGRWRDGAVEMEHDYDADVELAGRGFLLIPAAFVWPGLWAMLDPPWQPAIIYSPRGLGTLWAPPEVAGDGALDALLGARRARILAALSTPASTSDLAARLGASPAGVSEHLGVLRRAGRVGARRKGRAVLYARTEAGDVLIRAPERA